ncbi:MAG: hypothetical protein WBZ37_16810 [Mycobacterium sp.]
MTAPAPSRAAAWLPMMIRLTAAGYLVYFVPNLVLAMTNRVSTVFDWGQGSSDDRAVSVMFSTVYLVWAIYLFCCARAPQDNRLFLDFNLTANAAHFGVMLIMAITMSDEHRHIVGVLLLGLLSTVPLAACWLPVRRLAKN